MQDPVLGGTPTEPTEVHFAFNNDHLYMAVVCRDSEPDKLLGNTRKRDEFLSADDRFMWTMDTFCNEQTGYFFEMNPSGLMADALMGPGGTTNREWDGIWNARVRRSEIGWVHRDRYAVSHRCASIRTPPRGASIFSARCAARTKSRVWTGHLRNQGLRRMSNAGRLVGLTDVTQGHGLEVQALPRRLRRRRARRQTAHSTRDSDVDVGGEMAYNITPSLRARRDHQHRLRRDRSRHAARQPDALSVVLSREARRSSSTARPSSISTCRRSSRGASAWMQTASRSAIVGGTKLTGQAGRFDVGGLYVRTGEDERRAR